MCIFLVCNSSLQNFKCTFSMTELLPKPKTSQPYKSIGLTILSNRSSWHSIDKLCNFPLRIISYIARVAFSAGAFFALEKLPVLENNTPRYVNSLTISITFQLKVNCQLRGILPRRLKLQFYSFEH